MEIWNKIIQYLKNTIHVFICWGLFSITMMFLGLLVVKLMISSEVIDVTTTRCKEVISCDTIYVIVKPELDEIRITSITENKNSVWVTPLNNRITPQKAIKK